MSKKKPTHYKGELESLPEKKIDINVNHLEKGDYQLDIIHKNKVLTKAAFKKEWGRASEFTSSKRTVTKW